MDRCSVIGAGTPPGVEDRFRDALRRLDAQEAARLCGCSHCVEQRMAAPAPVGGAPDEVAWPGAPDAPVACEGDCRCEHCQWLDAAMAESEALDELRGYGWAAALAECAP